MTECLFDHQTNFPLLGDGSAKNSASRHTQRSDRGTQAVDRLLALLPSHPKSQPTSRISPFPPALLFSICDVLQHGDSSASVQDHTSVLPLVLSKLRDWRLLDPNYRFSSGGIHKLALDLAGITDEPPASTSSDVSHISHGRLRMKWVVSISPDDSQDRGRGPSSSLPPSLSALASRSSVLGSTQECAHVLRDPDLKQRRSDTGYEHCQASRMGIPDCVHASSVVSQRHHSMSGFRSGCAACCHPRISGPSAPPSPQTRMASLELFRDVEQFDTNVNTSVPYPKSTVQRTVTKKNKENQKSSNSIPRAAHVDENESPFPKLPGVQQGIGISFTCQRTHSLCTSSALLSRELFSPVATISIQRRMEPGYLPNRTREGINHTFNRPVTSVDHFLPIVDHPRTPTHASPTNLHPHTPKRAQSFSYTDGFESVANRLSKLSSNAAGRSSDLPSWNQTHCRDPAMTTTPVILSPTPLSPLSFKARSQNTHTFTPLRPWIVPSVPRDGNPRDRRSVSSQTQKYTHSVSSLPLSPFAWYRKMAGIT